MKKSNYNIFIPHSGFTLCYNSFTNNYIALSKNVAQAFQETRLEKFGKLYPKHYEKMVDEGVIIPEEFDELSILRYQNKIETIASRKMQLMIYPTQDCNLKCWYCYESHVKDSLLSSNISERIIKFVKRQLKTNAFDSFTLSFFGGEPLINFSDIAYPLCTTIKKLIEHAGKEFVCFFVTNGSLIDDDIINKFKEIKPHFQITLDGNKERHNTIRLWKKDDLPTYDTIIRALHEIVSKVDTGKFHITLRINYDNQTLKGVSDILSDIQDLDRERLHVHFERVWQTKNQVDEEQIQLLKKVLHEFLQEGFVVNLGGFKGVYYACPAETVNYAIINYDGSVHKCNGRNLTSATAVGLLTEDGEIEWDATEISKRIGLSTFENPNCLQCKMLPMCMGPCSQKILEKGCFAEEICTMKAMDLSLEDYLSIDFKSKLLLNTYYEE